MKKKKWIPAVIATVIVVILAVVVYRIYDMMFHGSVQVQMVDVISAVAACKVQLIVGGIILAIGIVCLIAGIVLREKKIGHLLSVQGCAALLMALVITITWICTGPRYSLVNNVFAGNDEILAEHKTQSVATAKTVAEEGITLLKNKDHALPLEKNSKINVFGWSSINPVYGGSGSGSTSTERAASLIGSLEQAGFETNKEIGEFYMDFRTNRPVIGFTEEDFTVPEPTIDAYEESGMFERAKEFSDTAVIVISRAGGEGGDLPMSLSDQNNYTTAEQGKPIVWSAQEDDLDASKSYLELSNREIAMVEKAADNFDNVIVVVNSAAAMELGWIDEYDSIKAALWCPSPGEVGFEALGEILCGEINPSGHLVDTYVYDLLNTPTINNFGSFDYDHYEDVTGSAENKAIFVNYNEGIYVGYKFYETAAAEGLIDYDSVVQFPFGYGLSYTTFHAEIAKVQDDGNSISLDVKVDNTGDTAGKFVAEIFYNPPYTNGGIEKASANLVEFAKTGMIEPGQSETVTIQFNYEDMASYDDQGLKSSSGAYVLEAGDYEINLCSDAHTVLDTYTANAAADIIYDEENQGSRSTDDTAAVNQFEYSAGNVTYLSRANGFKNYEESIAAPIDFNMTDEIKENYASQVTFDASKYDDPDAKMPAAGVDHGLTIQDMEGLDYEDARWDDLLDQLTVEELKNLIADSTYHVIETDSINLPYVVDSDGPSGVNSFFTGKFGTSFTAPVLLAATWNTDLAAEYGDRLAQEMLDFGITGWYGPGINIHRSAFSGRNFEYYSEDGVLSGKMAAREVAAAREKGITTYVKHFALNDSETDRAKGICTWATEQSIREIYLKGFELAVKEGGSTGVMNSKNGIGSKWAGANPELLNQVLRSEWGFVGCVMTDALDTVSRYYQDPNEAVRTGTDKMMPASLAKGYWYDESAGTMTALRNAAHNYLYAVANSSAMEIHTGTPTWVILFGVADAVIILLLAIWEVLVIRTYKRTKKSE